MAKENVLTVSVSGETVNIMVFEIQRDENDKITKIHIDVSKEFLIKNNTENISSIISDYTDILPNGNIKCSIKACIIDTTAYGMVIYNRIKDSMSYIPIHKVTFVDKRFRLQNQNGNIIKCFQDYIKNGFVTTCNSLKSCDFSDIAINSTDRHFKLDVAFMVNSILTYKEDITKENRKTKIKDNLNEVIEIFIEELNEIDKNDTSKLDNLLKMIDRINYVRGQI